jgi:acetyl-CoA carboxylase carboxyl transferase beta subunit
MVRLLVDPGSFEPWDSDVPPQDPLRFEYGDGSKYGDKLLETTQRLKEPTSEAILTGQARLDGREIALVISDFRFMGGSIGVVAGEKLVLAFERAIASSMPVLSFIASGGIRLQEGPIAFLQMVKSSMAAAQLRNAGLAHVTYLGNPSMGGALVSWGSLGTFTFAVPGALIGFAGPRAMEALGGEALSPDAQVAENLLRHGLIDDVVSPPEMRERVIRILSVLRDRVHPAEERDNRVGKTDPDHGRHTADPWRSVQDSRDRLRPGSWDVLLACGSDLTFLDGRPSERSANGFIAAVGRICGVSAVFLGHDRRHSLSGAVVGPIGLRRAQRAIQLARELRLPLVTVIDTSGAQLSRSSEEGGLSFHVAETMVRMATLESPTLSVILGEGGGGAALSLLPADRVLAAGNSWLAPIAPEGGSAILWGTATPAAVLARRQRITAGELERFGIVDEVVGEYPSASVEKERFLERLRGAIERNLRTLVSEDDASRLETRERRYRRVGSPLG